MTAPASDAAGPRASAPRDELAAARETITRLNRRAQVAEAALADLLRCNEHLASGAAWCSGSLGRAFLAYHAACLRDRLADSEAARDALTQEVRRLRGAAVSPAPA